MFNGSAMASSVMPASTSVARLCRVRPGNNAGIGANHGAAPSPREQFVEHKAPTPVIDPLNNPFSSLPFEDTADFTDADPRFLGALEPTV